MGGLKERLFGYARERYGSEPEYLWKRYPDCAVLRCAANKKWYAISMGVDGKSLGLEKGFRNEMLRLGIDESYGGGIRDGSPAVRIMQEAELRQPGLAARMRECLASPLRSTKQEDYAFFRMVLCHSAVPSE